MAEQKKTKGKSAAKAAPKAATAKSGGTVRSAKQSSHKETTKQSSRKETTKVSAQPSRFGDSILDEVILILIIVVALVAEISLLTEKMGVIGHAFNVFLKGLFGFGSILLPLMVIAYCGWFLASEDRKWPIVRAIGGFLLLLSIASGAQLIHPIAGAAGLGFLKKVTLLYGAGAIANGGLLGGLFGGLLYGAFGTLGSTLLLLALLIISIIMTTGKSFFHAVGEYLAHRKVKQKVRNEKIKSRAEQIRQQEQAELERLERRRSRSDKKKSYNIELTAEEREAAAPMIQETVFRPKAPSRLKKAEPIYNFVLEEPIAYGEIPAKKANAAMADADATYTDFATQPASEALSHPDFEIMDVSDEPAIVAKSAGQVASSADMSEEERILDEIFAQKPLPEEEIPIGTMQEMDIEEQTETTEETEKQEEPEKAEQPSAKAEQTQEAVAESVPEAAPETVPAETEIPYQFPPIELLGEDPQTGGGDSKAEMLANAKKLETTLKSFGVEAKVIQINRGPTVTRYELSPSQGVKVSKIVNLADDIALNLAASGIRIEAPIPGKAAVGIEVPNRETQSVYLRTVLDSEAFHKHPSKLAFALGEDIAGNPVVTDIAKMPHLLIAGATGSGKSVCINTLITSILYKADPKEVKLLLVDPKVVELSVYNGIPHLMIPVVTDPKKASSALNWAVREMLQRYNDFAACGVRDIKGYNAAKEEAGDEKGKMPQIVIVIDELADLMMAAPGEVEDSICRLAQMARAAGMHLIIATQRPSVDVITGVIKANIPSRLAFAVSSGIDSRTILDSVGAEKLLGKGDMLFYPSGQSKPARLQGAFVTDKEVEDIVAFLKKSSRPGYTQETIDQITKTTKSGADDEELDERFEDAVDLIIEKEKASVSMIQRHLRVGYNRAARIVTEMENRGMVGPEDGSKPRKVLITREEWDAMQNPVEEEID